MSDSQSVYDQAFALLKAGSDASIEQGLAMFRKQVESHPKDMKALFEYAGAFDYLGREAEARPLYGTVLEAGIEQLPADDQPRLFVQLGSTLRNLNAFDESRRVFLEGLKHFPGNPALKAFLSLTESSSGNHARASQLLFEVILGSPSDPYLREYSGALKRYSENL